MIHHSLIQRFKLVATAVAKPPDGPERHQLKISLGVEPTLKFVNSQTEEFSILFATMKHPLKTATTEHAKHKNKVIRYKVDGCDEMTTGPRCNLDFARRKCCFYSRVKQGQAA